MKKRHEIKDKYKYINNLEKWEDVEKHIDYWAIKALDEKLSDLIKPAQENRLEEELTDVAGNIEWTIGDGASTYYIDKCLKEKANINTNIKLKNKTITNLDDIGRVCEILRAEDQTKFEERMATHQDHNNWPRKALGSIQNRLAELIELRTNRIVSDLSEKEITALKL